MTFSLKVVEDKNHYKKWEAQLNNGVPVQNEDALKAIVKTGVTSSRKSAIIIAKNCGYNFT